MRTVALIAHDGAHLLVSTDDAAGAHGGPLLVAPTATPVPGEPPTVAALRALYETFGVLYADGPPADDTVRRAFDESPEAGHAHLAATGRTLRTDVLEHAGDFTGRGDVLAESVSVYRLRLSPDPSLPWRAQTVLRERWSHGELVPAPWLAPFLRDLDANLSPVPAWEVSPWIRMLPLRTPTIPPAAHTNVFLVGADDEAVLVEPASPYEEELDLVAEWLDELSAQGHRPRAILATHHHPDHVGGATALGTRLGLPLWAHAETAGRLRGKVAFDRQLSDGETVAVGRGVCVEAIHTPGHAPGHLCFLEPESGAMIAGDMVAGIGTILVEPTDGHMGSYLASLRRMEDRAPKALLPAHGGVIRDPVALLEHYVAHRLAREAKVVRALTRHGGPATAADLVPDAYDDAPRAVWPIASLAVEAHLLELMRQGKVAQTPSGWRPS